MKNIFASVLCFALVAGCSFPKTKMPQFKDRQSMLSISEKLKQPGNFETVKMSTKQLNASATLTLTLINGTDLPDSSDRTAFAGAKMKYVYDQLLNPADFSNFEVIIKTEKKKGILTTSTQETFDFSADELVEMNGTAPADTISIEEAIPEERVTE